MEVIQFPSGSIVSVGGGKPVKIDVDGKMSFYNIDTRTNMVQVNKGFQWVYLDCSKPYIHLKEDSIYGEHHGVGHHKDYK